MSPQKDRHQTMASVGLVAYTIALVTMVITGFDTLTSVGIAIFIGLGVIFIMSFVRVFYENHRGKKTS